MMQAKFCSKCGNTLKEGDKFCRKCGAPIRLSETVNKQVSTQNRSYPNIPSYNEVEERFNNAKSELQPSSSYNPEGTVLLAGPSTTSTRGNDIKRADILLSFEDMLRGCCKVVDFGTGIKYEIVVPPGLSPGDIICVKGTGIKDPETGKSCDIELTATIG